MGRTVKQSTKTTQWTVNRLADQTNSDQLDRSPSQKVTNQPTCKKVNLDSYLILLSWSTTDQPACHFT